MVRAAFRRAVKEGELTRAPYIEMVSEKGNERKGYFSEKQIANLLAALPHDGLSDFVEWASLSGQRKSEIAAMTWAMLNPDGKGINVPGDITKKRTARTIPLGPELLAVLERRRKARRVVPCDNVLTMAADSERIFTRGKKRKPVGDFKKAWATATKKANCPSSIFHDFRRQFAHSLLAAEVSQAVAMKCGGWESSSVFIRYGLAQDADLQLAAQKKLAKYRRKSA
jgi:integrase